MDLNISTRFIITPMCTGGIRISILKPKLSIFLTVTHFIFLFFSFFFLNYIKKDKEKDLNQFSALSSNGKIF